MEKECAGLANSLLRLSPKLHISITPRGYDDELLMGLCKTEEQKEQLIKYWQRDLKFKNCSTCNCELTGT